MFLISDKLEKSAEPQYEIMKDEKSDEKRDLMKEENLDFARKDSKIIHTSCLITLAVLLVSAIVLLTTTKILKHHIVSDVEDSIFNNSANIINNTKFILNEVELYAKNLTEYNRDVAKEYVGKIRSILKERTTTSVQKINQIVMNRTREIENELTSFDYVITDASTGIIDYADKDLNELKKSINSIESGDVTESLDKIFDDLEKQLFSVFSDIDQMYSFYGRYLGNIIDHKITNVTDRISVMLNSNRRYCDCTLIERINICYTISSQNGEIANQIEMIEKVIGLVKNSMTELKLVETDFLQDPDEQTRQLYIESKTVLEKALIQSEEALQSLLHNDDCFLGTVIQRESYQNHKHIKRFILRSFQTAIEGLAENLNKTTTDFQIVKEKHWQTIKIHLDKKLEEIGNEIYTKALLINSTDSKNDYIEKSKFTGLKLWMQDKFNNVTSVVNPLFETKLYQITDALKYNLQFIVYQQLPFISSLSVQNYLPSDICPLSVDFQKFVMTTLNEFLLASSKETSQDMIKSISFNEMIPLSQNKTDELNNEFVLPIELNDSIQNVPVKSNVANATDDAPLMDMVKNMLSYFMQNGYEIEGPVEVFIPENSDDDNKK